MSKALELLDFDQMAVHRYIYIYGQRTRITWGSAGLAIQMSSAGSDRTMTDIRWGMQTGYGYVGVYMEGLDLMWAYVE